MNVDHDSPLGAARRWRPYLMVFGAAWGLGVAVCYFAFPSGAWGAAARWSQFFVYAATLFVVWFYTDRTSEQVRLQREDLDRLCRPLLIVERVEQEADRGNVHFFARNIGPGVATNAALFIEIAPRQGANTAAQSEKASSKYLLNAMGSGLRTLLPEKAEVHFREDGEVGFALLAEGLTVGTVFVTYGIYRSPGLLGTPVVFRHAPMAIDFKGNLEDYLDLHSGELHGPIQDVRGDVLKRHSGSPRYDGKSLT